LVVGIFLSCLSFFLISVGIEHLFKKYGVDYVKGKGKIIGAEQVFFVIVALDLVGDSYSLKQL
jgi:hypothetical protein